MTTYDREQLRAQLIRHEGIRLKPYRCPAGKLTIGVGRNLDDRGISLAEAHFMLETDIQLCLEQCERVFIWFRRLDGVRQRVIVDLAFNLGMPKLLGFKQTLAAIANGEYEKAAVQMLASKWAQQVGDRAVRLARMMRTGDA